MYILINEYQEEKQIFYDHLIKKYDNVEFIVFKDNFFLPKGFTCITEYFINQYAPYPTEFKDIYYAFVDVPELWNIRAYASRYGIIKHNDQEKGYVYYRNSVPFSEHLVNRIEWFDNNHQVFKIDYYNRYGFIECSDFLRDNTKAIRTYYNVNHHDVLSYDYSTSSYASLVNGQIDLVWNTTKGFYTHILQNMSSLSLLNDAVEFIPDNIDIKDNSLIYYENSLDATEVNQTIGNKESASNELVSNDSVDINIHHECLILTCSDQIESLKLLVQELPEITFHIGANTLVSNYLMSFSQYDNVNIYPAINISDTIDLFNRCDIYLDINYGKEIFSSIEMATIHNLLIMGFDSTIHNEDYILSELVFDHTTNQLINKLSDIEKDELLFNSLLFSQERMHQH